MGNDLTCADASRGEKPENNSQCYLPVSPIFELSASGSRGDKCRLSEPCTKIFRVKHGHHGDPALEGKAAWQSSVPCPAAMEKNW